MSAAKITATKAVVLDGKADAPEVVTTDDVQDPEKLARGLQRMARDLAALRRRFNPQRIDFEDVVVPAAGASFSLEHRFGGRVRWWVVGWQAFGSVVPLLREDKASTTSSTLVLISNAAGTATIRVENAG